MLQQASWVWSHVSGQAVSLQSDNLLHLLEIERLYLQKQAQVGALSYLIPHLISTLSELARISGPRDHHQDTKR